MVVHPNCVPLLMPAPALLTLSQYDDTCWWPLSVAVVCLAQFLIV